MNQIIYFNTNNLLIDTPVGKQYGGVSAWQGIRYLGSENYLICGTTNPNPNSGYGLIYVGNIDCINGLFYYLNVPSQIGLATSVYGPNYNFNNGIYTFVGSYADYSFNIKGFIYIGTLDNNELANPNNFLYPSVNLEYDANFLHSNSNGLVVGNSGNNNKTISYIYNVGDMNNYITEIKFPGSITTTSYGIWYNGNNSYTIVGGFSSKFVPLHVVIGSDGIIKPVGNSFIVDYNSETNTFSNWTEIIFDNSNLSIVSHFQGIYGNEDGTYSINADVINPKEGLLPQGYFLTIGRNSESKFQYNFENWIKLKYNEFGTTSSNSIANNKVVGLYIGDDKISFQAEIIAQPNLSQYNFLLDEVKQDEKLLFNGTFLNSNLVSYNKGVVTFLEKGDYFVNFNIYVENTKLPIVIFEVKYTIDGKKKSFRVGQKGIDEIGTGTAHSLVIPCSFISKFNINDTFEVINKSNGNITLISNYSKDVINASLSLTKLN